eukprot:CAMPEP_0176144642 /NCGR_PEP_ID=MMETSP0120_2-20121206/73656_1 /TAXON_ID=160619 /ORGANISM="Kryptoperidinium foliaceum, Strain CCMP 1326" /LENGTH=127 /DNA_ID=CAMNT_0017481045 /DNA_START=104 /DNA_END=483 /DNA_ORIENTATION=+
MTTHADPTPWRRRQGVRRPAARGEAAISSAVSEAGATSAQSALSFPRGGGALLGGFHSVFGRSMLTSSSLAGSTLKSGKGPSRPRSSNNSAQSGWCLSPASTKLTATSCIPTSTAAVAPRHEALAWP